MSMMAAADTVKSVRKCGRVHVYMHVSSQQLSVSSFSFFRPSGLAAFFASVAFDFLFAAFSSLVLCATGL